MQTSPYHQLVKISASFYLLTRECQVVVIYFKCSLMGTIIKQKNMGGEATILEEAQTVDIRGESCQFM